MRVPNHKSVPALILAGASVLFATVIWLIFYPGMMSADSLDQYQQALNVRFHDWHPPIMAMILAFFIHTGLGLGTLMWLQSLAFVSGIIALAYVGLDSVKAKRLREAGTVAITALILFAIPPAAFCAMTFWKDAWLAILLLWSTALLRGSWNRPNGQSRWRAILLTLMVTGIGLLRHNAIILLPAFAIMTAWLVYRNTGQWRRSWGVALSPIILWFILHQALSHAPFVEPRHPSRQVMELDLVGLCWLDPDRRAELPHTDAHLRPHYQDDYIPGLVRQLYWIENPIVDPAFLSADQFEPLRNELLMAVRRYPVALTRLKLKAYAALLTGMPPEGWFHPFIDPNPFELQLNPRFEPLRARWFDFAFAGLRTPGVRWFIGSHWPWLLFGTIMLAIQLRRGFRCQRASYLFAAWCLSLPLLNAISFLPATVAHDYRFIYPSTLWLQIFFASWALRPILKRIERSNPT